MFLINFFLTNTLAYVNQVVVVVGGRGNQFVKVKEVVENSGLDLEYALGLAEPGGH